MNEGTDHAQVQIHPPVLTMLHLLAALLLGWLIRLPVPAPGIVRWLGIVLVAAGLGLGGAAVREFAAAKTTVDPHGSVSTLVTSGPYRTTRNPIYLGFVCILAGFPLVFGNPWGLILAPVLILLLNRLVIRHEEAYLERKFGPAYAEFKSRVRRWI